MPSLDTPLTIRGGCNCRAICYEMNVPPRLAERPFHPYSDHTVRLASIVICHCNDCRRACGTLTLAGIYDYINIVRISLPLRSSQLPHLQKTQVEPLNDDAERIGVPAQDMFKPKNILDAPPDSFLASYKPSEGITRKLCFRYGTHVTYSRHPMLDGWPEMLNILMNRIDREDLEKREFRLKRHVS